jgi:RNA-directed DNA polymerase
VQTFSNYVEIEHCKFFISPYQFLFSVISNNLQKRYKMKLKNLIKSAYNLNIIKLIELLNGEINLWKQVYNINSNITAYELDIYVYKLLWKFVKRYHPRRTNTWLYNKYWTCLSGVWRFSFYDTMSGNVFFLNFHSNLKMESSYLPLLTNIFERENSRKLFSLLFAKFMPNFKGINRLLFIRQKGLCNTCFKPLSLFNFKFSKFYYNSLYKVKYLHSLCLIHTYCSK